MSNTTIDKSNPLSEFSRRGFLNGVGAIGAGFLAGSILSGCGSSSRATSGGNQDQSILNAAATAEALATTMYRNIIASTLYTTGLAGNAPDQAYLHAGLQQEQLHYDALVSLGATPLTTTFYFPAGMFGNASTYQTTVNTLITLEDAFIAAYLIAIRDFSQTGDKVIAGQILGVESEHRTLGRVIANDLGLTSVTGLSGVAESVQAPSFTSNNLAYERTFSSALPNIAAVVSALTPFTTNVNGYVAPSLPFTTTLDTTVTLSDTTP